MLSENASLWRSLHNVVEEFSGLVAKNVLDEGYNYMSELHSSPDPRIMIAEINSAYQPALVVLGGVEAFAIGGPNWGKLVRPGVVLAGNDRAGLRMKGGTDDS